MRKVLMIGWLSILLCVLLYVFWYTDWRYSLPTPVPENYQPMLTGSPIPIVKNLMSNPGRPLFLHFFNPTCPCSRFNIAYFKELVHKYSGQVDFAIILLSNKKCSPQEIQEKFDLGIPVLCDSNIGKACGVYSTPQAVIIDRLIKSYFTYQAINTCAGPDVSILCVAIALQNVWIPIKPNLCFQLQHSHKILYCKKLFHFLSLICSVSFLKTTCQIFIQKP